VAHDRPIRVALVGYGLAGSAFHGPLLATTAGLRVDVVVVRDPGRAARATADHPGASVVPDVAAVVARAAELDLAVVATPNATHVAVATALLDAGLAVVVDKPVAPTAAAARALGAHARARGLPLVPFHNRRWDGDLLTMRRLLAEGHLGRVLRFESRFERWRPEPAPAPGWKDDPDAAAGILADLGTHLVDQVIALFGPPATVRAELDVRRAGARVDDDVFVALRWADDRRAHLWASALAAQRGPRFRVLGTAGAYVKHGMDVQEDLLRAGDRPGPGWGGEDPAAWGHLGVDGSTEPVPTEPGDYPAFYRGLVAHLRDGAPPPVPWDDAVAGLAVLDAARRSAAGGEIDVAVDVAVDVEGAGGEGAGGEGGEVEGSLSHPRGSVAG
jgi:scyllo-inositol 2-dehydrogenase (NADP+)